MSFLSISLILLSNNSFKLIIINVEFKLVNFFKLSYKKNWSSSFNLSILAIINNKFSSDNLIL